MKPKTRHFVLYSVSSDLRYVITPYELSVWSVSEIFFVTCNLEIKIFSRFSQGKPRETHASSNHTLLTTVFPHYYVSKSVNSGCLDIRNIYIVAM